MKFKIAVAVVLVFTQTACRRQVVETSAPEISKVRVAEIGMEEISFPVTASGIVVPAREIRLSFKTGGIIEALHAEEGNRVKQGTLLASLNLSEINAQVEQASNGYEKAVRDYNRAKNLYADSVATLEQLQNATTAMNLAKAAFDIAVFNQRHSKIFAPEEGVILKKLVETNEVVAAGYPVFVFGTTGNQWKIKAGVADRNYIRITEGDSARVTVDAYPGEEFTAVVSRLGEAANPQTGTYEVEFDLIRVKRRLAAGFVANLEILPSRADRFYRVPVESLVEAQGEEGYVYAITDSLIARKVKVSIAGIYGTRVAVSDGLKGVKRVATDGAAYLSDGEKVEIAQ
ncbi:MAG: efflux RND transporter periplasmic adaptor subunit [Bacteroidales bacterium]|nr:efflux RND transporter periplasmic adaptor subunit [Bacteroidales bacterium]